MTSIKPFFANSNEATKLDEIEDLLTILFNPSFGIKFIKFVHSFKESKIGSLACDLLNIYPSDVSIEKTYDYTDNRLIVICSSGYSWHEVSTRRYAATPRINFHGGLSIYAKDNKLTKHGQNRNLEHPLKNKLKHLIGLFNF